MTNEKISGIYRIVCVKNNRYYYGSSNDIWRRWRRHRSELRRNCHNNTIVQRSWNKHGENSFHVELVEGITEGRLLEVEQRYLNEHVGKSNCMNIADNAQCPSYWKGRSLAEETKLKISESLKGRKLSVEHRRNISESMSSRYENPAAREKTRMATLRQWADGRGHGNRKC